jgi:hypothetical protein
MLRRLPATARRLRRISTYAFAPAPLTALPVDGSALLFPVRRVFCVGRNYAAVRVCAGEWRAVLR